MDNDDFKNILIDLLETSKYNCASGKSFSDCHIHEDRLMGCLECGNFEKTTF